MQVYGLESVGFAIPQNRVALRDIHDTWQSLPLSAVEKMATPYRAVVDPDEDAITLGVEAARMALERSPGPIGAVVFGSQTPPYISRSCAAIISDMLGLGSQVFATDVQFSSKSGTTAMIIAGGLVGSGMVGRALAIGADTLGQHCAPGDPQELSAAAGAGAVIVGTEKTIGSITAVASHSSDTPDGFRLDGERYLRTGGTGMAATRVGLIDHVSEAWCALSFSETAGKGFPDEICALAYSQTNGAAPQIFRRAISAPIDLFTDGLVADKVGDTGSAGPILSLARVLKNVQKGDKVGLIGYGVGAGADAILIRINDSADIEDIDRLLLNNSSIIDYPTTVRYERRYQGHEYLLGAYE